MNQAQIAFIFPTFNRPEEVIFNLIFFRENITIPYEVFVLDNSPEAMEYDFLDNENYIFLGENKGTAARNIGIQRTSAPICLLLDDDSHPMLGTTETIIDQFTRLPEDCAGIICSIHNPDGGQEASLLPTVFHGAGVAFSTEVLLKNNLLYPDYCFYGEEYRLTAEIYRAGYKLQNLEEIKIMHRRSAKERDISKIFYYLGRNNTAIWKNIVPDKYKQQVIYDSNRRYELTSKKENVFESYEKGLSEKLISDQNQPMNEEAFTEFSLINQFQNIETSSPVILAGTGKFPSLWTDILTSRGIEAYISDFNSGLIGHSFKNHIILSPEEALKINGTFILGHSSTLDTAKWQDYLETNNKNYIDISDSNKSCLI
jgi:GT2 family glycosyltransferase